MKIHQYAQASSSLTGIRVSSLWLKRHLYMYISIIATWQSVSANDHALVRWRWPAALVTAVSAGYADYAVYAVYAGDMGSPATWLDVANGRSFVVQPGMVR